MTHFCPCTSGTVAPYNFGGEQVFLVSMLPFPSFRSFHGAEYNAFLASIFEKDPQLSMLVYFRVVTHRLTGAHFL